MDDTDLQFPDAVKRRKSSIPDDQILPDDYSVSQKSEVTEEDPLAQNKNCKAPRQPFKCSISDPAHLVLNSSFIPETQECHYHTNSLSKEVNKNISKLKRLNRNTSEALKSTEQKDVEDLGSLADFKTEINQSLLQTSKRQKNNKTIQKDKELRKPVKLSNVESNDKNESANKSLSPINKPVVKTAEISRSNLKNLSGNFQNLELNLKSKESTLHGKRKVTSEKNNTDRFDFTQERKKVDIAANNLEPEVTMNNLDSKKFPSIQKGNFSEKFKKETNNSVKSGEAMAKIKLTTNLETSVPSNKDKNTQLRKGKSDENLKSNKRKLKRNRKDSNTVNKKSLPSRKKSQKNKTEKQKQKYVLNSRNLEKNNNSTNKFLKKNQKDKKLSEKNSLDMKSKDSRFLDYYINSSLNITSSKSFSPEKTEESYRLIASHKRFNKNTVPVDDLFDDLTPNTASPRSFSTGKTKDLKTISLKNNQTTALASENNKDIVETFSPWQIDKSLTVTNYNDNKNFISTRTSNEAQSKEKSFKFFKSKNGHEMQGSEHSLKHKNVTNEMRSAVFPSKESKIKKTKLSSKESLEQTVNNSVSLVTECRTDTNSSLLPQKEDNPFQQCASSSVLSENEKINDKRKSLSSRESITKKEINSRSPSFKMMSKTSSLKNISNLQSITEKTKNSFEKEVVNNAAAKIIERFSESSICDVDALSENQETLKQPRESRTINGEFCSSRLRKRKQVNYKDPDTSIDMLTEKSADISRTQRIKENSEMQKGITGKKRKSVFSESTEDAKSDLSWFQNQPKKRPSKVYGGDGRHNFTCHRLVDRSEYKLRNTDASETSIETKYRRRASGKITEVGYPQQPWKSPPAQTDTGELSCNSLWKDPLDVPSKTQKKSSKSKINPCKTKQILSYLHLDEKKSSFKSLKRISYDASSKNMTTIIISDEEDNQSIPHHHNKENFSEIEAEELLIIPEQQNIKNAADKAEVSSKSDDMYEAENIPSSPEKEYYSSPKYKKSEFQTLKASLTMNGKNKADNRRNSFEDNKKLFEKEDTPPSDPIWNKEFPTCSTTKTNALTNFQKADNSDDRPYKIQMLKKALTTDSSHTSSDCPQGFSSFKMFPDSTDAFESFKKKLATPVIKKTSSAANVKVTNFKNSISEEETERSTDDSIISVIRDVNNKLKKTEDKKNLSSSISSGVLASDTSMKRSNDAIEAKNSKNSCYPYKNSTLSVQKMKLFMDNFASSAVQEAKDSAAASFQQNLKSRIEDAKEVQREIREEFLKLDNNSKSLIYLRKKILPYISKYADVLHFQAESLQKICEAVQLLENNLKTIAKESKSIQVDFESKLQKSLKNLKQRIMLTLRLY